MLVAIFVILLILWLLGVVGNYTFGGLIHLLLVVGLVVLVLSLAERGGRPALSHKIKQESRHGIGGDLVYLDGPTRSHRL